MKVIKINKLLSLILLCSACCIIFCGCSENSQEAENITLTDTNAFNTGNSLYDDILNKIAISIDNGDDVEPDEYSYVYGRFGNFANSKFGYSLIDVNGDGKQELVVGESGSEEYPSILYDMYMMDGKKIVHVFSGGERDRFYATDIPNAFCEEGSSSAEESFFNTYVIENGKLVTADFTVPPNKVNLQLENFKKNEQGQEDSIQDAKDIDDMFIPYSFLEERTGRNFFESKEDIITNLNPGEGYAVAKMENGEDVILISEKCYSLSNDEYVSINAVPYYKTNNGYEYGNTPFESSENDYPIKLTNDGNIICAGSHIVEKYMLIINDNRRGFSYKYTISESSDENQKNSYSGFVTDFETETTSNFDEDNDGAAFYIEAMEEYQTSVPVTFTVIFE